MRIDAIRSTLDQEGVESVLHICPGALDAEDALHIGLVFGKEQLRGTLRVEAKSAERSVFGNQRGIAGAADPGLRPIAFALAPPGPGIAEPQRGQQMQRGALRAAVGRRDTDQKVVRRGLGILDRDVEVSPFLENARVFQLELRLVAAAPAIFLEQPVVRKGRLRILIKRLQISVRGRGIQVVVTLLDVLAVIALWAAQPKQPFLQDGVVPVPESRREAQPALAIADAQQPVFPPAIGTAARMVVWKVGPAFAGGGVILPHGAPLALGKIGPPAFPVFLAALGFGQPRQLGDQDLPASEMAITFLMPPALPITGSWNASMG